MPNALGCDAEVEGAPNGLELLWLACPKGLDVAAEAPAAALANGLAAPPPPKGFGFCPKLEGCPKAEPPPSFAKPLKPPPVAFAAVG